MNLVKINRNMLQKKAPSPAIRPVPASHSKGFFARSKKFLTYRRKSLVQAPWATWSEYLHEFIYIPTGFVYGGTCVHKILNSLYGRTSVFPHKAIVHCFGYRYEGLILVNQDTLETYYRPYAKKELDKIFEAACTVEAGLPKASFAAKKILQYFSWPAWRKARKLNETLQTN